MFSKSELAPFSAGSVSSLTSVLTIVASIFLILPLVLPTCTLSLLQATIVPGCVATILASAVLLLIEYHQGSICLWQTVHADELAAEEAIPPQIIDSADSCGSVCDENGSFQDSKFISYSPSLDSHPLPCDLLSTTPEIPEADRHFTICLRNALPPPPPSLTAENVAENTFLFQHKNADWEIRSSSTINMSIIADWLVCNRSYFTSKRLALYVCAVTVCSIALTLVYDMTDEHIYALDILSFTSIYAHISYYCVFDLILFPIFVYNLNSVDDAFGHARAITRMMLSSMVCGFVAILLQSASQMFMVASELEAELSWQCLYGSYIVWLIPCFMGESVNDYKKRAEESIGQLCHVATKLVKKEKKDLEKALDNSAAATPCVQDFYNTLKNPTQLYELTRFSIGHMAAVDMAYFHAWSRLQTIKKEKTQVNAEEVLNSPVSGDFSARRTSESLIKARQHKRGASYSEIFQNGPSCRQLRFLYDAFISPQATWPLDIDAKQRKRLQKLVGAGCDWNLEMYDQIAETVRQRICQGTFVRWREGSDSRFDTKFHCESFEVEEWV